MSARRIRCNDEVVVLTGKDRGKRGKVKLVLTGKNKAVVSGVNLSKKHQKPIPDKNQVGGIFKKELAIDLSNIAIFNPETHKADRVMFKVKNGKKIRVFKSNGNMIK